jgi:asparagine synthase (glutamine-hydrolysing)
VEPLSCSFTEAINGVAAAFDQPIADASSIAALQLARLARRHVTVVLSGTGGDDMFGGYYRHRAHALRRAVGLLPAPVLRRVAALDARRGEERLSRRALARSYAARLAQAASGGEVDQYLGLVGASTSSAGLSALRIPLDVEATLTGVARRHGLDDPEQSSALRRVQRFDVSAYLAGDLLAKEDRCSMAVGLEARVPLLDAEVVALAAQLPDRQKATLLRGKVALRQLAKRRLPPLPHGKRGFAVPLQALLRGPWRKECTDWLRASKSDLVSSGRAAELATSGVDGPDVWALSVLVAWEDRLAAQRTEPRARWSSAQSHSERNPSSNDTAGR